MVRAVANPCMRIDPEFVTAGLGILRLLGTPWGGV
jgi:hypothetical protein